MSAVYTRSKDINDRVKDVQLTITQWRVLFSINENTPLDQIKTYVEDTAENIESALDLLMMNGLIAIDGQELGLASENDEPAIIPEPEVVTEKPSVETAIEPEPVLAEEPEADEVMVEEEIEVSFDDDEPVELEAQPSEPMEETISFEPAPEPIEEPETVSDFVLDEEPLTEPVAEAPAVVASSNGKKSILVVDESIVIRKMVEIAFEDLEYNIHGYSNGQIALDEFESVNPSVVLIDAVLKDIRGIDLMNKIKEKKDIPVLMFCTKTNPKVAKEVEDAGADGLVNKPFNDDDLIEKIQKLVK